MYYFYEPLAGIRLFYCRFTFQITSFNILISEVQLTLFLKKKISNCRFKNNLLLMYSAKLASEYIGHR